VVIGQALPELGINDASWNGAANALGFRQVAPSTIPVEGDLWASRFHRIASRRRGTWLPRLSPHAAETHTPRPTLGATPQALSSVIRHTQNVEIRQSQRGRRSRQSTRFAPIYIQCSRACSRAVPGVLLFQLKQTLSRLNVLTYNNLLPRRIFSHLSGLITFRC
jgi:hypothetical protein